MLIIKKSYITAPSFAHKVARLAIQSELNLSISLFSLKLLKIKLIHSIYTWGTGTVLVVGTETVLVPGTVPVPVPVPGTGTILIPGTETVLIPGTGTVLVPGTGTVLVSQTLVLFHSVLI